MAQAVVIEQYGGPEVLKLKEVQVGAPQPNEVRLQHTRIGVNFHDVYVRSGLYKTLQLPGIPGIEAAGVVTRSGSPWTRPVRSAIATRQRFMLPPRSLE